MNKAGERMKEWFSLKKLKTLGMDKLLIFLLGGIFLLVICIPTGAGGNAPDRREKSKETGTQTTAFPRCFPGRNCAFLRNHGKKQNPYQALRQKKK